MNNLFPPLPSKRGNPRKVRRTYLVIGLYSDTGQRYADSYVGANPAEVEAAAVYDHPTLTIAAVLHDGKVVS